MRTLGIDLASQPAKTAACRIDWADGGAVVAALAIGVADDDIAALATGCDAVGIDAPFGWPAPFVAFLCRGDGGGPDVPAWDTERRTALSYRLTDLSVWRDLRRPPLSVAADRIALPAMRCAALLDRLGVSDRSGDGRVFEVYPAAALHAWGFASGGYKGPGARPAGDRLPALLGALRDRCPWLDLPAAADALCRRDDDAFDALVSALVARTAGLGLTARPSREEALRARVEGWIAVPKPGSLDMLASVA